MPDSPKLPTQRFQFSLRWLLVVVTLVAILLGFTSAMGLDIIELIATSLFVVFPTPLIVTILFARDEVRAFAIGGLVPWASTAFLGFPFAGGGGDISTLVWLVLVAALSGALAVATRRWIDRQNHGI